MHLHLRDWRLRYTSIVSPTLGVADQTFELIELGYHVATLQHRIEFFLQTR